jgi:hypothetical protein
VWPFTRRHPVPSSPTSTPEWSGFDETNAREDAALAALRHEVAALSQHPVPASRESLFGPPNPDSFPTP